MVVQATHTCSLECRSLCDYKFLLTISLKCNTIAGDIDYENSINTTKIGQSKVRLGNEVGRQRIANHCVSTILYNFIF